MDPTLPNIRHEKVEGKQREEIEESILPLFELDPWRHQADGDQGMGSVDPNHWIQKMQARIPRGSRLRLSH
jgi:hypothetical protein